MKTTPTMNAPPAATAAISVGGSDHPASRQATPVHPKPVKNAEIVRTERIPVSPSPSKSASASPSKPNIMRVNCRIRSAVVAIAIA
ncbi:MAG TPA: hypothetical protein VMT00_13795 [Thermoanaerobaculia bacterium]|nr:hypothetical protein [Thermoanaerobaculia bacterium]